jgi:hypothetical protein
MIDEDGWQTTPRERKAPGFSPGLEERFEVLWQQVCGFSAKWTLYIDLFGKKESRDVLSDTAPGAFELIESSLRNDMTMSLGRLTDPRTTGNKDNLSLERFIDDLKSSCPPVIHNSLLTELAEIRDHVKPFKERRNRIRASSDAWDRRASNNVSANGARSLCG